MKILLISPHEIYVVYKNVLLYEPYYEKLELFLCMGQDLIRCSHCHITRYCSVQCQRVDWDLHRFACSVWQSSKLCSLSDIGFQDAFLDISACTKARTN